MNVQLLDCTLRDGGYVNNWNFGYNTTICILDRLIEAGVDIIEVGFLDERENLNLNRTIQPDSRSLDTLLAEVIPGETMLVAMIDYGTCSIEHILPCNESKIDGIRVIFKRPKMKDAILFGKELSELGYKVFLQIVSITDYSDKDIIDFIKLANEADPYAVSMVDTYGLMHKEKMLRYFSLLDQNLNAEICIGYHSHNNFQLAYANTCELIKFAAKHDIIVDGTVYGIGKSAGNAPLELLAMYLNENHGKRYELNQILEVIDTNILRIYQQKQWGYSLHYFLSASNNCHPNYINYLLSKKTLSVASINEIASNIPDEFKLNYNQRCVEELYRDFQKKIELMGASFLELQRTLSSQRILIIGPGPTIASHQKEIECYINNYRPIIISTNFVPPNYSVDYLFISNAKRYNMLSSIFRKLSDKVAIIASSNITTTGKPFDYLISYEEFLDNDLFIEDNALIMLLKALCRSDDYLPSSIALAGFDGFAQKSNHSYFDEFMELGNDYLHMSKVNDAIIKRLPEFRGKTNIIFLTPSLYESN